MPRGARADSRADTAIAILCVVLSLILLVLPPAPRDTVAGLVRGNLVGPLAMMQQRASLARRSFLTNDSIAQLSDSILQRSQQLDELTAENDRLRDLLGLGRALRWGFIPAEALVGRGMGDDFTFVLSAGERAGVEPFSAVVAADGLVGMVTQVDPTTSIAITWPHPDFRVSATSEAGDAFGIVSAHQGEGAERYLLELHGVPYRATLDSGTAIVSSGLGGVFPRGVLIGSVVSEIGESTGWSRSYLVRPAVRPTDVTQVMILLPERNAEGVESVWRATTEAMAQRVQEAGDSLYQAARDSAARVAAREQFVRDSLLRDSLSRAIRDSIARAAAARIPRARPEPRVTTPPAVRDTTPTPDSTPVPRTKTSASSAGVTVPGSATVPDPGTSAGSAPPRETPFPASQLGPQ